MFWFYWRQLWGVPHASHKVTKWLLDWLHSRFLLPTHRECCPSYGQMRCTPQGRCSKQDLVHSRTPTVSSNPEIVSSVWEAQLSHLRSWLPLLQPLPRHFTLRVKLYMAFSLQWHHSVPGSCLLMAVSLAPLKEAINATNRKSIVGALGSSPLYSLPKWLAGQLPILLLPEFTKIPV